MNRRNVLLAAALAPWAWHPLRASAGRNTPVDVLVIGAGMAGISAARELQAAGLRVRILEARQRIGGRIHTDASLGVPVDVGAAWIHGAEGNPLTALAGDIGMRSFTTDFDSRALYSGGRPLDAASSRRWLQRNEADVETLLAERDQDDAQATVADGLDGVLESLEPAEAAARRALLSAEIEAEYGEDGQGLSLAALDEDEAFDGDDLLLAQGYGHLVEALAVGLDIQLGAVVHSITRDADGVQVSTANGTWSAPQVVITLPLGVLAAGAVRFEPGLGAARRAAMDELGMGALGKRILKFKQAFWPTDVHRLLRLDGSAGRTVEVWNLLPLTGEPVLAMLSAGDHNRALERLNEAAAQADALAELGAMFGKSVPTPVGFLRTRWSVDPFSLGSYSVVRPGGSHQACQALGKSIDDQLYFAGEATHSRYPATVHGALLSGQRVAREVLAALD